MTRNAASTPRRLPRSLMAAAALGGVHAGFGLHWAAGGTGLVWSLGSDLVASFQWQKWWLAPIGAIKPIAAVAPPALSFWGWPVRALTRAVCRLGASVLIIWGGLNTVVAHPVLAEAIQPGSGLVRPGMIGHAWWWDPLFRAWGAALVTGLLTTRNQVLNNR